MGENLNDFLNQEMDREIGREEIIIEDGVKGVFVKAKARTLKYDDWILLVSNIQTEIKPGYGDAPVNMVYCYGCKILAHDYIDEHLDEVNKKPFSFGDASHYRFYIATKEEKKVIIDMLKAKNLKYVKGINKVVDR
jgi:hypothetical protein